jgi:hypothetical protein
MRIRCSAALLAVSLLAPSVAWASPGVAAARKARRAPAKPVVLHAHFDRVATGIARLQAEGRFVLLGNGYGGGSDPGRTLIDDRTGDRTLFSPPGCVGPVIGGQWLAFNGAVGSPGSPPPADCETQLFPLAGATP